jgi:hypothetical protein
MDFDQDFVGLGNRFLDLSELKAIRWSVFGPDDRFHSFPPNLL